MIDRPSHNRWTARDVSRLLALIENERRYYQEIISALPAGVCAVTADLEIVYANRAFRQELGHPADEMEGDRLAEVIGVPDLRARVRRVIATRVAENEVAAGQGRTLAILPARGWDDSGGEVLVVVEPRRSNAAPIPAAEVTSIAEVADPAVSVAPVLAVPGMIWRRRSPEFEVEKLGGEFEAGPVAEEDRDRVLAHYNQGTGAVGRLEIDYRVMLAGRTAWVRDIASLAEGGWFDGMTIEITEWITGQAIEAQAAKLDPLARLSSRVGHDLNNISTLIRGYSEELRGALSTEDARRDLDELIEASGRLTALAKQLHGYSRRPPVSAVALDLGEVLGAAFSGRQNITIAAPAPGPVMADRQYLLTALTTLVSYSAVEPGQQGPVVVNVEPCPLPIAGGGIATRVSLAMTALPFAAEKVRAAFEPLTHSAGDLPVNLAAVEWVIRRMGGAFLARPHPAHGTVYDIYLRRAAAQQEAVVLAEASPEAPAVATERRARVMVVEDEPGVRALLRKMLERQSYAVFEAESGMAALALIRSLEGPVDLVVTDVRMPGMTGIEMVHEMRNERPDLRVLYVSGYSEDAPGLQASLSATTGFVQKPFEFDALLDKVRELVAGS